MRVYGGLMGFDGFLPSGNLLQSELERPTIFNV